MANRFGQQFSFTMAKQVWKVYLKATIGASGAVTLDSSQARSNGIVSITKEATAGQYTVVFGTTSSKKDVWPKFYGMQASFISTSAAPAAPIVYVDDNSSATAASCSITVQCLDYAGNAANPASGEVMLLEFTFSNSTAT